jgi:excisionase family DNA binding protein
MSTKKNAPMELALVTTAQAAQLLQVTARTIENLIRDGHLPVIKIGSMTRIPTKDVERIMTIKATAKSIIPSLKRDAAEQEATARRESLLALRSEAHEFQLDLALGKFTIGSASFDNKLGQVIITLRGEIDRQLAGDRASKKHLQKIGVNDLVARLLSSEHVDTRHAKKSNGEQSSLPSRNATRLLRAALELFDETIVEAGPRFPKVDFEKLASSIWFAFYGVTKQEAESDAAKIRELLEVNTEAMTAHAIAIGTVVSQEAEGR